MLTQTRYARLECWGSDVRVQPMPQVANYTILVPSECCIVGQMAHEIKHQADSVAVGLGIREVLCVMAQGVVVPQRKPRKAEVEAQLRVWESCKGCQETSGESRVLDKIANFSPMTVSVAICTSRIIDELN